MYRGNFEKWHFAKNISDINQRNRNTRVRDPGQQLLRKIENNKGFEWTRSYRRIISVESHAKTLIYTWTPKCKWLLVAASAAEFMTPEDELSIRQYGALTLDGLVWAHRSMKMIPLNWNYCLTNAFLCLTSMFQFARAINYLVQPEETEHGYKKRTHERMKKLKEKQEESRKKGPWWYHKVKTNEKPHSKREG